MFSSCIPCVFCLYYALERLIEVELDGISPFRFGATSWSFPAMNYWVEATMVKVKMVELGLA